MTWLCGRDYMAQGSQVDYSRAERTFGNIDSHSDPAGPLARSRVIADRWVRPFLEEMPQAGETPTDVKRQGHDSARNGGWR